MEISTTADYALRAVLFLARHDDLAPIPADRIAEALGTPPNYLSKTLHQLAGAGVVRGYRGPKGGFRLAVPADELSLASIVQPFDALTGRAVCLMGDRPCTSDDPCAVHDAWTAIVRNARRPLAETTVADLLAGRVDLGSGAYAPAGPSTP